MLYIIVAVSICVALLTMCVGILIDHAPLWATILLVLSAFTFGFILGENNSSDWRG
jgi:hypothetical protein